MLNEVKTVHTKSKTQRFWHRYKKRGVFVKGAGNNAVFGFGYLALFLVCFFQVFIVVWMMYTSLKDDIDVFLNMFALPKTLHFENYAKVFKLLRCEIVVDGVLQQIGLAEMFKNSLLIAFLRPIKSIVTPFCVAYVLSKFRFRGRNTLMAINMFVIVFPIVGSLPASLKISYTLHMFDNLFLQSILGAQPFGFNLLVYLAMFNMVSDSYKEAATIDGAGPFTIFFRIYLPMTWTTPFVFYILSVLGAWNDYMTPLVWLPSYANVALGMFNFQYDAAKYSATLPEVLAGFVMMSVPSVLVYALNQNMMTSKLVVGGLKG